MFFAVFLARLRSQEHAASFGQNANWFKDLGRHYRRFRSMRLGKINGLYAFRRRKPPQKRSGEGRIAEVGLAYDATLVEGINEASAPVPGGDYQMDSAQEKVMET